ncbi:UDP-N-acetylglucosamine 2-epimerase [Enterovibrio norvegicus]|uniref:UDP-N-acetylglucosamine 2-epimerase n=1 Tax=Enterovibrio norvegicus TaxID=188144 RepID=UPI0002F2CEB4|nr:UDP-N-acetylglucosamine 2-epimerase [Enterovibrio norvegicus]OEF59621.1 UDP-N-acetylglucosamine 2-epimerase [Enterovibrio norvegicus]
MIFFFVGTTAELIKLFPIMVEMDQNEISYEIISSGQNDITTSTILTHFGIKKPSLVLSDTNHKKTALGLVSWFAKALFTSVGKVKSIAKAKPGDVLVVHGDTVSTVLGAFLGKLIGMKICHVEAGLRSYNYFNPFPEELDRVVTSRLAHVHFAPNEWAVNNLKNKKGKIVNTRENTLIDGLRLSKTVELPQDHTPEGREYFVFVIHRQENLFDTEFVKYIVERCVEESKRIHCVLVLHELTKIKLIELGMLDALKSNSNVTLIPRLEYVDFMKVLANSRFMVTDGGSNQEEAYYMGIPCLILRTHTERVEGLEENVLLSKKSRATIEAFFDNPYAYQRESKLGSEYPSRTIVDELVLVEGSEVGI